MVIIQVCDVFALNVQLRLFCNVESVTATVVQCWSDSAAVLCQVDHRRLCDSQFIDEKCHQFIGLSS